MNRLNEILKYIVAFLLYIVDLSIVFYGLYFLLTGLFAFKKIDKIKNYEAKHKLAVLIAARNESKVILHLIKSLKEQKYPKELYEIFVIPNNCTDNTEEVSKKAGAKIIDCIWDVKSKGDVLKHTLKYMGGNYSEYDSYVIFDADNIVHENFLSRMNDVLCENFLVAQGNREAKNPWDSWISNSYSLFYLTQNLFFNKARTNIGVSSSINGTGFMVSKKVIDKFGFETYTLTEDVEFAGQCALNGVKIVFVEDAITFDEQPVRFGQSWKQRTRWTMGVIACMRIYSKKLFKSGLKNKRIECIDMSLFYMAPVVQIFVTIIMILYANLGIYNFERHKILGIITSTIGYELLFGYLFSVIISLVVLKVQNKSIRKSLKGVFTLFIFMLTWIPINIICLFKKEHIWEQIEHSRELKIDTLIDKNNINY